MYAYTINGGGGGGVMVFGIGGVKIFGIWDLGGKIIRDLGFEDPP